MPEATLAVSHPDEILALFGPRDVHLRKIRKLFDVRITARGNQITIMGDEQAVDSARRTLEKMRTMSRGANGDLSIGDVTDVAIAEGGDLDEEPASRTGGDIKVQSAGRRIKPRTRGQAKYVDAIRNHDLTFATGPAGCGKTYLAVATAVEALKRNEIRKLVLCRPAVEAGESLGFLPGDLRAKLNPYLRPLMDALGDMVDQHAVQNYMEQETIEIIPLAYMRGRTLNDAFIILDEAQNTTAAQMKMFLTRMGRRSKMVVSGDATQQDLPRGTTSGLRDAIARLSKIDSIGFIRLGAEDIVRHALVQRIVEAYEKSQP